MAYQTVMTAWVQDIHHPPSPLHCFLWEKSRLRIPIEDVEISCCWGHWKWPQRKAAEGWLQCFFLSPCSLLHSLSKRSDPASQRGFQDSEDLREIGSNTAENGRPFEMIIKTKFWTPVRSTDSFDLTEGCRLWEAVIRHLNYMANPSEKTTKEAHPNAVYPSF